MHGFVWDNGTKTDLGTFGPVAVNNRDQIAGNHVELVNGDFLSNAFLFQNGQLTALGTLGGDGSEARTLNERGQIVGRSTTTSGASHAFLWQDGTMTDLGTLGGAWSEAIAVTGQGQVVGNSATATGATHGFLWQDGVMTDLGTLGGAPSVVGAVNDRGQIVGRSATATGQTHAFLWQDGTMTDLGTLGGDRSDAEAINKHGQIAGWSNTTNFEFHVFVWDNGTMTDLGTPLPFTSSSPFGPVKMNDRGQIVGAIAFAGSLHGGRCFLWQDGAITELPTGLAGDVVALNNHKQAVGWTFFDHDMDKHALLWTLGRPEAQVAGSSAAVAGAVQGS
jgi:probable HAF family extracellular repeat protein